MKMAAAQGSTESLFLSLSSYDHYDPSKRVRRDSRSFQTGSVANSFSYSSGFELSSPGYTGKSFQDDDSAGHMDQQTFNCTGPKFNRSQAFEEFYNSLDLRNYIGFGSSLSASARSIQNGERFFVDY